MAKIDLAETILCLRSHETGVDLSHGVREECRRVAIRRRVARIAVVAVIVATGLGGGTALAVSRIADRRSSLKEPLGSCEERAIRDHAPFSSLAELVERCYGREAPAETTPTPPPPPGSATPTSP
jgi:hypothetical protein